MENCIYLHDSYITEFDFENFAFANFVVAWLPSPSGGMPEETICSLRVVTYTQAAVISFIYY